MVVTGRLLVNRVAIVTGGSSGLGRATAAAFRKHGATVVYADLHPPPRESSITESIPNHDNMEMFVETNVSNEESIQQLIRAAVGEFGRIDIMVNNAGVASEASRPLPIWEACEKTFDLTHRVNVRGVFLGCKYAGGQMLKQERLPNSDRLGTIINLSSVLGVLGKAGTSTYAATKGAVLAMTRAAAMDFAPHGIHCNSILPGFTRTPMISTMTDDIEVESQVAQAHPLRRLGEPEEIADAAVFLASHMSRGITGLNMSVDGGLHAQLGL